MVFTGINPEFAVQSNLVEQKYPALQVNNYRPSSLKETINFCLSKNSFNLIASHNDFFKTEIIECNFGRESISMHQIVSPVRWIFLNIPRIYLQDKTTKEVFFPEKGVKLFGTNRVTIAKCFLACLVGNHFIMDERGYPQIFTLKLTSSKTQLIGYQDNREKQTLLSLNREIQKHFQTKNDLVHLVSLDLEAKPKEFVSNHSGASALGVVYELIGNAKVLSSTHQKQIFDLVTNQESIAQFDDPFGLKLSQELNLSQDDVDF